jgi:hypothetical protein
VAGLPQTEAPVHQHADGRTNDAFVQMAVASPGSDIAYDGTRRAIEYHCDASA